jgi:hypothetical protein
MKKINEVKVAEATIAISNSLAMLETLRVKRSVIDNVVKDTRTAIDKRTKEIKTAMSATLKGLDVATACAIASDLCKSVYKADESERAKNQRRRNWLRNELIVSFPTYDIINTNGTLTAVYEGDKSVREAKEVHAMLTNWHRIGLTMTSTLEEVKAALSCKYHTVDETVDDGIESTDELLSSIAASISGQVKGEERKVSQA